jgi:hypothetical protein
MFFVVSQTRAFGTPKKNQKTFPGCFARFTCVGRMKSAT